MISFRDAPINEVVIGKVFEPVMKWLVPYFGKFWGLVEDEFPSCEDAPTLFDPTESVPNTIPLPRVWLIGADRTRLLQLQRDRFYCNWRQTQSEDYIRFSTVFSEYQKYEAILSSFVSSQFQEEIRSKKLELTYGNILTHGKEWDSFSNLDRTIRDLRFIEDSGYLGKISNGNLRLEYFMRDAPGRVAIAINSAKRSGSEQPVIRFELTAMVRAADLNGMAENDWYTAGHDAIVNGFVELTTLEAQEKHWHRIS